MPKIIDLVGRVFGRLTVTAFVELNKHHQSTWRCRCKCGAEKTIVGIALTNGATRSCGCYSTEVKTTHGASQHGANNGAYRSWIAVMQRCTNKKCRAYKKYGARGVTICNRYKIFENLLADIGPRPPGMEIDRFPNRTGNYDVGNVRWATRIQQQNNKENNRRLTLAGRTQTIAEWSRELGIPWATIDSRIKEWMDRGRSPNSMKIKFDFNLANWLFGIGWATFDGFCDDPKIHIATFRLGPVGLLLTNSPY